MNSETKYQPASLNDVIYPTLATEYRVKNLAKGHLNNHVIFYGPNGTSKTTTANLLAHAIGGTQAQIETDFVKLLAMPDLKSSLQQRCINAKLFYQSKLILLFNEFDNYKGTPHHLWGAMDQLQSKGLMLIITTNNLMSIHASIRSRCLLVEFPAITAKAMLPRAQHILSSEGLALPDEQVLDYLKGQERYGDIRKYLQFLDVMLSLHTSGHAMPPWSAQKPKLTVV